MHLSYKKAIGKYKIKYAEMKKKLEDDVKSETQEKSNLQIEFDRHQAIARKAQEFIKTL